MKFYHATTNEIAEKIRKEGVLKAGCFGVVFLCRTPLDACKFLVLRGVFKISVVEVNLRRSDVVESHDHSEAFFQCKAYTHRGDILIPGEPVILGYDFRLLAKEK